MSGISSSVDGVVDVGSVAALPLSSVFCCVQPEELTLLLIKLRRQQAELTSLREHTVAQLMALGLEGPNAKVSTESVHNVCACTHWCFLNQAVKKPYSVCFCVFTRGGSLHETVCYLQTKLLSVCSERFCDCQLTATQAISFCVGN